MLWYVSQDRKTEGPLSEERIGMLIHWGKVTRRAYVCDEHFSGWVSIERTAFARLLKEQPEEPEPEALGVLRGAPLRFSSRALQRLGAVLAAVGMFAGALALADGVASSRRNARDGSATNAVDRDAVNTMNTAAPPSAGPGGASVD